MYNIEQYIEKCICSCLKQDVSLIQYEIIIVNDGSTDRGEEIVNRISQETSNVRIISKPNGGLSSARNTGLVYAQGEYVWFVDGDDFIEENCLGRIFSFLKDNLDILQLQYRLVYEDGGSATNIPFYSVDGVKTGTEIFKQGGLPAPAPFSIFRTSFLKEHRLEFVEGIYHEDSEFKPRVVYHAKKVASDMEISYNYLQRLSGSITSHYKLKNGLDMLIVANSLLNFVQEQKIPQQYQKYFHKEVSNCLNTTFFWIHELPPNDREVFVENLKRNRHVLDSLIKSKVLKYQLEGLFFKCNLKFGLYAIESFYKRLYKK